MKIRVGALVCTLLCCTFVGSSAYADVINFDDLVGFDVLPAGYGGVNWHDEWLHTDAPHPNYPAHSPEQRIFNSHYGEYSFFDVEPIVFEGAWFSGTTTVQFYLYLDHVLVATSPILSKSDDTPKFLSSGYSGLVDSIAVREAAHGGLYGYYTMDDVTFDGTPVPAPEPETLALLGAGALGLLVRNRRRPPARRV